MPNIKFVMTVTNGRAIRTFQVDEDKQPGGLYRMELQAIEKACIENKDTSPFNRGDGLWVLSNWTK